MDVQHNIYSLQTYFRYQERHNLNMSILSPQDPFVERILFWMLLLERTKMGKYILPATLLKL